MSEVSRPETIFLMQWSYLPVMEHKTSYAYLKLDVSNRACSHEVPVTQGRVLELLTRTADRLQSDALYTPCERVSDVFFRFQALPVMTCQ